MTLFILCFCIVPPQPKVLFHFKGWSAKFDEWIDADSERIHPHNLHTDPTVSDPRAQEKWQGAHNLAKMYSSMTASGKPRASAEEEGEEADAATESKGKKGKATAKGKANGKKTSAAKTSSVSKKRSSTASTGSAATGSSKKRSRTSTSSAASNSSGGKRRKSSTGSCVSDEDSDADLWDDCFGKEEEGRQVGGDDDQEEEGRQVGGDDDQEAENSLRGNGSPADGEEAIVEMDDSAYAVDSTAADGVPGVGNGQESAAMESVSSEQDESSSFPIAASIDDSEVVATPALHFA